MSSKLKEIAALEALEFSLFWWNLSLQTACLSVPRDLAQCFNYKFRLVYKTKIYNKQTNKQKNNSVAENLF